MDVVTIYTDGSCDNRIADCGGAAAVIRYKDYYKEVTSGSWSSTTNNRMELLGIIIGLEAVKSGFKISLTSDSEYSLTMCKTLMRDIPSKEQILTYRNGDLLLRLNECVKKHKGNLNFNWVKGHTGVTDNERCDVLAGEVALKSNPTRDVGSGIDECPNLGWWKSDSDRKIFLGENSDNVNKFCHEWVDYIGSARKMSKKEINQILRNKGWKNKEINEYEIDTSYYKKPI